MDANSSHPDDLNSLERRLAAWQPAAARLAADAMLFAAGRASARGGKAWLAWPVVSGCLAVAAVTLGAWLSAERSERLALARELHQRAPEPALASTPVPDERPATEAPAADAYLVLRRQWEQQQPVDWAIRPGAPGRAPASPQPSILRAWQPAGPPEPL